MVSIMKLAASMMLGGRAICRVGLVSAYQGQPFSAKVRIMHEDVETGWLPIVTVFGAGGWGLAAAPVVDAQAVVIYQESDPTIGMVLGFLFSVGDQPPGPVASGDMWLTHGTGSLLKFTSDGNVTVNAHAKMIMQASEFDLTGTVKVTGDIHATGTVTGDTDVKTGTIALKTHVHPGVTSGPSVTGTPQ
jgi:phage baseplate assembly protein gpV